MAAYDCHSTDIITSTTNGSIRLYDDSLPIVQLIFDILGHLKWQKASTHYELYMKPHSHLAMGGILKTMLGYITNAIVTLVLILGS